MKQCLNIILVFSMMISGCAVRKKTGKSETEPIPIRYEEISSVQLIWEPISDGSDEYFLNFIKVRLLNPASSTIRFQGYSSDSPQYRMQRWVDGAWVEHRVVRTCGTGLGQYSIPPGRSSVITVHVTENWFPIRIGVVYSRGWKEKGDLIVWSEKIDHK